MKQLKIINSIIVNEPIDYSSDLTNYLNSLTKNQNDLFVSNSGTPWIRYEQNSFVRFPIYNFNIPNDNEIKEVFKQKNCFLVSYNIPFSGESSDAYIYICRDRNYSFTRLPSNMQRNLKKAENEFQFKEITKEELFSQGFKCFHDTRKRVGLNDYKKEDFLSSFANLSSSFCYKIFGVVKNDELAAFIIAIEVANWVEIGLYSQTDFLKFRPNDLLIYNVIKYYLLNNNFDFVSFGLSSIQANQNDNGLHRFKLKVGFEAIPVQRKFIINRKLFFLQSFIFKFLIKFLLKIFPKNRKLKKMDGVLERLS